MHDVLDIAVVGPSLRGWDGHAATWCALLDALRRRGHRVRVYECGSHTPRGESPHLSDELAACRTLYDSIEVLRERHAGDITAADVVLLGSSVPGGASLADWLLRKAHGIVAFYDLDTPVTLAQLHEGDCEYLRGTQIPAFDLYLSATGGPVMQQLQYQHGACARALYCAVDAKSYAPESSSAEEYDLGYLGCYSEARQRLLRWYLLGVAAAWPRGRFAVAGSRYPENIVWPGNVARIAQLLPARQRAFYAAQAFVLNVGRAHLSAAGWSPGVRLFEAAACGMPVISAGWPGIDTFFAPGKEILLAHEPGQVLDWLRRMPTTARRVIGAAARRRVLAEHTADHRAETLERYIDSAASRRTVSVAEQQGMQ